MNTILIYECNQSKIPNSSFHSGSRLKKSYFPNVAITYYVKHVLSVKHVLTVKHVLSVKHGLGPCNKLVLVKLQSVRYAVNYARWPPAHTDRAFKAHISAIMTNEIIVILSSSISQFRPSR